MPIMTSAAEFADFARAHLPQPFADQWIGLLRPAVVFPLPPAAPQDPALRHGGDPQLPGDVDWPMLEGYGPMTFVAELDCAALAAVGGVDLLPESGHLLFFCADYRYEGADQDEDWWRRMTPWTQGRVIHVPAGVPRRVRQTPDDLEPLESDERLAEVASTPPSLAYEWAERYFGSAAVELIERQREATRRGRQDGMTEIYPLWANDFGLGLHSMRCYVQTGGHSYSVQRPLEIGAARHALERRGVIDPSADALLDEAEHWRVLLQDVIDDIPVGYWLLRDDDLKARRFDRAYFEIQR